jgi:LPXTG-site transpeptidase (sortase) family protein
VFWELRNIKIGDEIEVYLGTNVYKYRVTTNQSFNANTAPWNQIVSATAQETLTLITCTGSFTSGEYDSRTVVTAVRI